MSYAAKIVLDSVAPCGSRLTTFELTFPRFVLAEFNTHRQLSRNAASSRAIPVEKRIAMVDRDTVMPVEWGKNQRGMVADVHLPTLDAVEARAIWLDARDYAVDAARRLAKLGVHKQLANRILEPFAWITVIASATEWANFFSLRCSPDAQPEIRYIAEMALDLYLTNEPTPLKDGAWHMPYVQQGELGAWGMDLRRLSAARCARVSYLTHDGYRGADADMDLFGRLVNSGHWSPLEHVAQADQFPVHSGNFIGFRQYRKSFDNEVRLGLPRSEPRA